MNNKTPQKTGLVVFAYGPQPMEFIGRASKFLGRGAQLDQDVARMAGANFCVGDPEALQAARQRLMAGALQSEYEAIGGHASPASSIPGVVEWLAHGERGASSEALFTRLTGVNATRGSGYRVARNEHPYDPADLRRCRLMLEQCHTLVLQHAAGLSPEWDRLIENWELICSTMDEETPGWRIPENGASAPKTYALIKLAIK